MSYSSYVEQIKTVPLSDNVARPNIAIDMMNFPDPTPTTADNFAPQGGISSYIAPNNMTYTVYTTDASSTGETCTWVFVCNQGAISTSNNGKGITGISTPIFNSCGFDTRPYFNVSLPLSGTVHRGYVWQPAWSWAGLPCGVYFISMSININIGGSNVQHNTILEAVFLPDEDKSSVTFVGGDIKVAWYLYYLMLSNKTYYLLLRLSNIECWNPTATIKIFKKF